MIKSIFIISIISTLSLGCQNTSAPKNSIECSRMCGGFGQVPNYDSMSGTCVCESQRN